MAINNKIKIFDVDKNLNIFNLKTKQNDTDGARSITFKLIKNNKIFDLTGLTIKVGGKKPDGKDILVDCKIIDKLKGIIELELTTQMQTTPGNLNLELLFFKDGIRLSSIPFEVEVLKGATDLKGIISSDEFASLNTAIDITEEYAEKLKEGTEKIELQYANKLNEVSSQLSDIITPFTHTNNVKMIAHRGLSSEAPENTVPSFELAAQNGYWGAETDVFETSDGHFVIMHDETVDRMTDGTGKISELTLNQIKSLTIDAGNNIEKYPNLKVPTLQEFLIICKQYSIVPVIELKTIPLESCNKFIQEIRKWGLESTCVVISFDKTIMESLRNLSKTIILQPLLTFTQENVEFCASLGKNTCIDVHHSQVTKELVNEAHSKRLLVNCWTVDDKGDMLNVINAGIDFITTNRLVNSSDRIMNLGDTCKEKGATLSDLALSYFPVEHKGYVKKFNGVITGFYEYNHIDSRYTNSFVKERFIHKALIKINNPMLYIEFNNKIFDIAIHMFDENKIFIYDSGWIKKSGYNILTPETKYIVIYCRKLNEAIITNEDLNLFGETFKCINGLKEEVFSISNLLIEDRLENTTEHRKGRAFSLDAIRVKGRYNIEIINYPTAMSSECWVTARPFDTEGNSFADIGWISTETKKGILDNKTDTILPYVGKRIETEFTEEEINKIKNMKIKLSL